MKGAYPWLRIPAWRREFRDQYACAREAQADHWAPNLGCGGGGVDARSLGQLGQERRPFFVHPPCPIRAISYSAAMGHARVGSAHRTRTRGVRRDWVR
jgi:hypothetical protein